MYRDSEHCAVLAGYGSNGRDGLPSSWRGRPVCELVCARSVERLAALGGWPTWQRGQGAL